MGEAKCIEDEENSNDQNNESSQNSNSGASDKEAHTQKFEKSTKLAENTSSNRKDNDVRETIPGRPNQYTYIYNKFTIMTLLQNQILTQIQHQFGILDCH